MSKLPPQTDPSALLPPHVASRLNADPITPPRSEQQVAALLLSDISGFTALTSRLQARGRDGAEEIQQLIRRALAPAVEAVRRLGGSIVGFGGDSLFTLFHGHAAVRRALTAAERTRVAFARRPHAETSVGPVALEISQAIHYGRVHELYLGTRERSHYLPCGPSVCALARLEQQARAGQILVSPAASQRLSAESSAGAPVGPQWTTLAPRQVQPFLPAALRDEALRFGGQYRRAVILFLETRGWSLRRMQAVFLVIERALERHGGVLLKSDVTGDGTRWLCMFGVPQAHEDDPRRAALTALELRRELPPDIRWRAGVHAGVLVSFMAGAPFRCSFDVMGDVVNMAARLSSFAEWGDVVISQELRERLTGLVSRSLGEHVLKGSHAPQQIHRLVGVEVKADSLRVTTPFTGRRAELATIVAALQAAQVGEGAAVGVRGEAGMGKSRLRWEVERRALASGLSVHRARVRAVGRGDHRPFAELIRSAIGLSRGWGRELSRVLVRRDARRLGLSERDCDDLEAMLGTREAGADAAQGGAELDRANYVLAARNYLMARARVAPQLYILEDVQWADETTRQLIEFLAPKLRGAVLLLLYRPGYVPPASVRELVLGDLSPDDVRALVAALLAHEGATASESVARVVIDRAGGNPFYVEEILQHFREVGVLARPQSGAAHYELVRAPNPDDLPPSLESLIAARIDRLSETARRVVRLAAVIGRTFTRPILARVLGDEAELDRGLAELERRQLVFGRPDNDPPAYTFKHALTRDVAYGTLLRRDRRRLHQAVVEVYEADGESSLAPETLAYHWQQAEEELRALPYFIAAADRCLATYETADAIAHYRHALDTITAAVAADPDVELPALARATSLYERLGRALLLRGEYDAAEDALLRAWHALERAAVASPRDAARVLGALARVAGERRRFDACLERCEQAIALVVDLDPQMTGSLEAQAGLACCRAGRFAEADAWIVRGLSRVQGRSDDDPADAAIVASLYRTQGNVLLEQGRAADAIEAFEAGRAACSAIGDRVEHSTANINLGLARVEQGAPEQALHHLRLALAEKETIGDRWGQGHARLGLARLHNGWGDPAQARAEAERGMESAREIADRKTITLLSLELGTAQNALGNTQAAERAYRIALETAEDLDDGGDAALALLGLSRTAHECGELEAAALRARDAIAAAASAGPLAPSGEALVAYARLLATQGRFGAAARELSRARDAATRCHNAIERARLILALGRIQLDRGALDEARDRFEEARSFARQAADHQHEGHAALGLAEIHALRGELEPARARAELALRRFDALGSSRDLAEAYALLSRLSALAGQLEHAESYARRAVERCEAQGMFGLRGLGRAHLALGGVYFESRRYDAMIKAYQDALAAMERCGDRTGMAETYRAAALPLRLREPRRALELLQRSLTLARASGKLRGQAKALCDAGALLRRLGELAEAELAFRRALEIHEHLGDPRGVAAASFHLATISFLRGQHDAARDWVERSVRDAEALDELRLVFGLELRARILDALGDASAALRDLERALALATALGHDERVANIRRTRAEHYLVRGDLERAAHELALAREAAAKVETDSMAREFGFLVRERITVLEARLAGARGDWQRARALLVAPLRTFDALESPIDAAEARNVLLSLAPIRA
ncbi:MAG: tetratricopeptide repeat protein [Myxococcales bacterium]|nr:tetratricopeptide repeat protein [Myxococcales bacterium]